MNLSWPTFQVGDRVRLGRQIFPSHREHLKEGKVYTVSFVSRGAFPDWISLDQCDKRGCTECRDGIKSKKAFWNGVYFEKVDEGEKIVKPISVSSGMKFDISRETKIRKGDLVVGRERWATGPHVTKNKLYKVRAAYDDTITLEECDFGKCSECRDRGWGVMNFYVLISDGKPITKAEAKRAKPLPPVEDVRKLFGI